MCRGLLFILTMMSIALTVSAQFSNVETKGSSYHDDIGGWGTVYVEWSPSKVYDWDINAFTLGLARAFSLSSNIPIYIEPSVAGQCFVQYHNNDYGVVFASIKVPVNLLYRVNIPNSKASFIPFAGLYLRYNVWGNHDMFDYCKRFQVGGHVGLKAAFGGHFIMGVSYGSDFNDIDRIKKLQSVNLSLGVAF